MTKIKLGITDDDEVFRRSTARFINLSDDIEVILEAENGLHLLEQLKAVTLDVILMDIEMAPMNGIQATREVMLKYPQAKIIAISHHDFGKNIGKMFKQGVKGFLSKECTQPELFKAIREVHSDGNYVTNKSLAVFRKYIKKAFGFQKKRKTMAEQAGLGKLTRAELKVLLHIACLKSNKEIAAAMDISYNTVNNHKHNICKKLGLKGRNILTQYALSVKNELRNMVTGPE
jgi:DNA-binding NarL/FixJ family response regulator